MNILFVGFGPHTRRIQFPYCVRKSKELGVKSLVILELKKNRHQVEKELQKYPGLETTVYYTDQYIDRHLLKNILKTHAIDRVVLGTDPEHHAEYLKFFIKNDLSILMDKPIVAVPHAATDPKAARKIHAEFRALQTLYEKHPKAKVTILSQRRYHPGYLRITEDLIDNYNTFDIVPHYFYLLHSDGQLRMLEELDTISYHGFNHGYGKLSHSGYHFIDTLYVYLKHFINIGKIDSYSVSCHALSPGDYSQHLSKKSITGMFKHEAEPYLALSTGEIDAYITIQLKKDNRLVASARIDMLHSGFSDRLAFNANEKDLYKGNGRIRHEKQIVLQGPLYAAYIDSLQSKQIDLEDRQKDLLGVGGEHHFDLTRFNHSATGRQVLRRDTIPDLMQIGEYGLSRGHQEEARYYCLDDFFASSARNERSTVSDLSDHYFSSLMMSKFYEALASEKELKGTL